MDKKKWEIKTLGDCGTFTRGGNFLKSDFVEDGVPCVHYGQIHTKFGLSIGSHLTCIPKEKAKKMASKGDLLIAITSEDVEGSCKCTAWLGNYDVALGGHSAIYKHNLHPLYVAYYFNSASFYREKSKYTHGFKVVEIKPSDIAKIHIPVPPLAEQQEIVDYLDKAFAKIDALKKNAEQQLSDAKALFSAALEEAMTPKEGWDEKKLGEIATDMYRGSGIKRDQVTEHGISCVRYGEIYTTYNYFFDKCKSHTNEEFIKPRKYFEHGDILFAITGESVEEIGKSIAYLGNEKCLAGGDIVVMKHNLNPQFLSYALSTKKAIDQKGQGKVKLKVVHTNIPALQKIVVAYPSLPTQQSIVAHLDALSAKVNQLQENYNKILRECDALKQALLREIFE